MDKIKKMWRNLSLRKSIILYISAFVILAILLSAGTATLCNNATKTIESKYPPTGEKYYLTNEELQLLKKLDHDSRISNATDLYEVNVGLVSGENDFLF